MKKSIQKQILKMEINFSNQASWFWNYCNRNKKGVADEEAINQVTNVMTTLNDAGLEVAKHLNANAITDVTGFGLWPPQWDVDWWKIISKFIFDKVPIIEFAKNYFHSGIYPSGSQRNFDSVKDFISFEDQDEALLLADAKTSGGLLISAPIETVIDLTEIEKSYGVSIQEIGNITDRYNQKINIISNWWLKH